MVKWYEIITGFFQLFSVVMPQRSSADAIQDMYWCQDKQPVGIIACMRRCP
jgi:benzoyl-CoA reductase/2-hydroxyglutaryl-CoA dehydratase subunit BcrC/BadD/HgdB